MLRPSYNPPQRLFLKNMMWQRSRDPPPPIGSFGGQARSLRSGCELREPETRNS